MKDVSHLLTGFDIGVCKEVERINRIQDDMELRKLPADVVDTLEFDILELIEGCCATKEFHNLLMGRLMVIGRFRELHNINRCKEISKPEFTNHSD